MKTVQAATDPMPPINTVNQLNDWTLTGFLVFLTIMTIWKGIPAVWGRLIKDSERNQEILESLIQWQKESLENISNAVESLKNLHQSEMELLKDIKRDLNQKIDS